MGLATTYVRLLAPLTAVLPLACSCHHAYRKTPAGVTEVKTLPASKAIRAGTEGDYYDESNRLFRRLFNYIKTNEVAMTVPVESRNEPARMRFYVGPSDAAKDLGNSTQVEVLTMPERTVASHGSRGAYTGENFAAAKARLKQWLGERPDLKPVGPPYAVYWNSPFVPNMFKRFEVHVPISRSD